MGWSLYHSGCVIVDLFLKGITKWGNDKDDFKFSPKFREKKLWIDTRRNFRVLVFFKNVDFLAENQLR